MIKKLSLTFAFCLLAVSSALAQTAGVTNWTFTDNFLSSSAYFFSSAALGPNGTIYVGASGQTATNGDFCALNPTNGAPLWHFPSNGIIGSIYSSPAIAPDGSAVYFATWLGSSDATYSNYWKLYALNPTNGTQLWASSLPNGSQSSPAVGPDGRIYLGVGTVSGLDAGVMCFDPDGTTRWVSWTNGGGSYWVKASPSIAADGTIYAGDSSTFGNFGLFHAIRPDGTQKWVLDPTPGTHAFFSGSPAIGTNGVIYAGRATPDAYVYAIEDRGTSGVVKWKFTTIGSPSGYRVIGNTAVSVDGVIYIGSDDAHLYSILDLGTTCATNWIATLTGEASYTGPTIASDGLIYVGGGKGAFAFNPDGTTNWYCGVGGDIYASPALGPDASIFIGSRDAPVFYSFHGPSTNVSGRLIDAPWPRFGRDQFHSARDYNQGLTGGLFTNGNFRFQITGPSNCPTAALKASTNLVDWVTLTNVAVNGQFTFTDSAASNYTYRFYCMKGQRAWSTNAYGFIHVTAKPGDILLANQLDAGNNSLGARFPSPTPGTRVYKWDEGLQAYTLASEFDQFSLAWTHPEFTLDLGLGYLWRNPSSSNETLNFIGSLKQGYLKNSIGANTVLRSSYVPWKGYLDPNTEPLKFPMVSGDKIQILSNGTYVVYSYPWTTAPLVSPGDSFFSQKSAATSWIRFFSATPP